MVILQRQFSICIFIRSLIKMNFDTKKIKNNYNFRSTNFIFLREKKILKVLR